MKKVLVTGAGGFIARHCISFLLDRGYQIHATVEKNGDAELKGDYVKWHRVDLLDPSGVSGLMREVKPTHLLHFAWYTSHGKFWHADENLPWVGATLHLVQEFRKNGGQRVVGAGTCAEYDWRYGYCVENVTPLNPASLYGKCKSTVQNVVREYASLHNINFSWGRIFFLYGPFENPKRLIAYVISSLIRNQTAQCSHGNQIRDFLHVIDVADAFVSLLDSDVEGPINIASGQPHSLRDILDKIGEITGRGDLIAYGAIPGNPGEPALIAGDTQRLKQELNWTPAYNLEDGLANTIHWWKENLR